MRGEKLILKWALFELVVFMLLYALIEICGGNFFNVSEYGHFDTGLYMNIAENGYEIVEAKGGAGEIIYNGNCGWFPLYPYTMRFLHIITGLPLANCGVIISFFFSFLLIILLSHLFLEDSLKNGLIILMIFAFPGGIWLFSIFPMSMAVVLMCLNLYFLIKKKYLLSGIMGFLCCMSYSSIFLICAVDFIVLLIDFIKSRNNQGEFKKFCINVLTCPVISFGGFIATMFLMKFKTGHFFAFFMTQAKYGHGLHNPFDTLKRFLTFDANQQKTFGFWILLINYIVLVYVIYITVLFVVRKMYTDKVKTAFYLIAVVFYIFMLIMGSGVSPYRQYLIIGISCVALKDEHWALKVIPLLVFMCAAVPVTTMFLRNIVM